MPSALPKSQAHQQGPEAPSSREIGGASFFQVGEVAEGMLPGLSRSRMSVGTDNLQAAWAKLLVGYDWQWFATCTFRDAVHPERADKAFRYWLGLMDRSRLGNNYKRDSYSERRCRWVRALEWQKREVLHYHALIGNLGVYDAAEAVRLVWQEEWQRLAGYACIRPYSTSLGVCGYVAKYVTKGGQIDVSPTLRPLAQATIWQT